MTTRVARSLVRIQLATRGPCWSSFGTVRKKNPLRVPSTVRLVRVAEPETKPSATIASAAVSASRTAIAPSLALIQSPPLGLLPRPFDDLRRYLLSSYPREAGLPDGWNTPRIFITLVPLFSMRWTSSGGRWKHEPGRSGTDLPP